MPNPYQPRIKFSEDKLKELAETIRKNGIIQPIVVRKSAGRHEIVSGERRWQASKMANLETVNVIIRNLDDKSMLESAIIENIEREDLNPIEIARAVRSLQERFNLTQDEIAEKLSKDRTTVSNLLRLLTLSEEIQKLLLDGKIEFGHAKAILSVPDELKRQELAAKIAEGGWSVRRAEEEARRIAGEMKGKTEKREGETGWEALEREFSRHFGTETSLRLRKSGEDFKGTIEIRIHSTEDVNRILGIVRKGVL